MIYIRIQYMVLYYTTRIDTGTPSHFAHAQFAAASSVGANGGRKIEENVTDLQRCQQDG